MGRAGRVALVMVLALAVGGCGGKSADRDTRETCRVLGSATPDQHGVHGMNLACPSS